MLYCAPATADGSRANHADLRIRATEVSARGICRIRIHRTDLRVDLVTLPETLSRARCLRTDAGACHIHGRYGARILADRASFAPHQAAAVGIRAGRGHDRDSWSRLSPDIRRGR